ncbi:hypothetical protein FRB95_014781, partial [Tulasnella sp. JGI-2019a]
AMDPCSLTDHYGLPRPSNHADQRPPPSFVQLRKAIILRSPGERASHSQIYDTTRAIYEFNTPPEQWQLLK